MPVPDKRRILITGASVGLGHHLATRLKQNVVWEVITLARTGDVNFRVDINDRATMRTLINDIKPHVIINNAASRTGTPTHLLNTNAIAPIELCLDAIRVGTELVLNIGTDFRFTQSHVHEDVNDTLYAISKIPLQEFSERMSRSGIATRMINFEPGWMETEGMGRVRDNSAYVAQYTDQTMQKIPIKLDDAINAILYLISLPSYLNASLTLYNKQRNKRP